MAGLFSVEEQHHSVSNKRFYALLEWAMEVGIEISGENTADYVSKMQEGVENIYFPCTYINFGEVLNEQEKVFWSKAFQVVAHKLFDRSLGSLETNDWRSSAIADACIVSRMLQESTGEYLDYRQANF